MVTCSREHSLKCVYDAVSTVFITHNALIRSKYLDKR